MTKVLLSIFHQISYLHYSLKLRSRNYSISSILLLVIPIALSAFTHLWNPIGFPTIHSDENTYLLHAMYILEGQGALPQGAPHYDHPYFGQSYLATALGIIGYPSSLNPKQGDVESIQNLYMVPRLFMGILSVIDTFLVYKIAERKYGKNVAFIAAVFFAVMPISWLLRRVLLDNLLLPLVLLSVFFAVSIGKPAPNYSDRRKDYSLYVKYKRQILLILISGIFLGLGMFTKVPVFAAIPLVGYLVFVNSNKSFKALGIWLLPVVLIPMIWPALALSAGQFDSWLSNVIEQATGREDKPLFNSIRTFFSVDPVLLLIGGSGIVYAMIKRDFFILLWSIPYLLFLQIISFVDIVHMISLLPVFCIAGSIILVQGATYLSSKIHNRRIKKAIMPLIISGVSVFGLISISILISANLNFSFFESYALIVQYLTSQEKDGQNIAVDSNDPITLIGRYWTKSYLWIPQTVFHNDFSFIRDDSKRFEQLSFTDDKRFLFVVDRNIVKSISDEEKDDELTEKMRVLYNETQTVTTIKDKAPRYDRDSYPYTSMTLNRGIGKIEIRANYGI